MKKIDINLEEYQYNYLLSESKKNGKSITKIIRDLINKSMTSKGSDNFDKSFWNIGEDDFTTKSNYGSKSHDDFIYNSLI